MSYYKDHSDSTTKIKAAIADKFVVDSFLTQDILHDIDKVRQSAILQKHEKSVTNLRLWSIESGPQYHV